MKDESTTMRLFPDQFAACNLFSLSSHFLVASAAGEQKLQQSQTKRKTDHEILISFAVD